METGSEIFWQSGTWFLLFHGLGVLLLAFLFYRHMETRYRAAERESERLDTSPEPSPRPDSSTED